MRRRTIFARYGFVEVARIDMNQGVGKPKWMADLQVSEPNAKAGVILSPAEARKLAEAILEAVKP